MTPIVFICAAGAASLYAVGSLQIKRSLNAGAPKRRAIAVTNLAMALWALPLFFISRGDFEPSAWLTAVAAGIALFLGRILAVQALFSFKEAREDSLSDAVPPPAMPSEQVYSSRYAIFWWSKPADNSASGGSHLLSF